MKPTILKITNPAKRLVPQFPKAIKKVSLKVKKKVNKKLIKKKHLKVKSKRPKTVIMESIITCKSN